MGRIQFLLSMPFSLRQRKLQRKRQSVDRSEFVAIVERQGGDREAAGWIWDRLRADCSIDDFSPRPADEFGWVFGVRDEDLDEDFVLGVFKDAQLRPPTTAEAAQFGPIDTPLRLAQFVANSRKGSRTTG